MDEKTRRAEELLEERLKRRGPNGHTNIEEDGAKGAAQAATDEAPTSDSVEALTNDLKRMTADFANYRKRNEAEGTVIREHQKAYRLHDRVIRPAMVTVAKKKESN